ncbi:MAG: substrate-binding domain-containing protein [Acidobacteria bacterium]|nr:substrate-binding domain-containing protein [Acidobacteriota bacterium]
MRTLIKLILALLLSSILLALTGCGYHDDKEKYYLVSANIQLPYWQAAASGLRKAAHEMGVQSQLAGPDSYDPQAEVQEFRKAVAAKPAGILVSPADPKLMGPEIDQALQAGIPVITVDSDAPDSKRLFYVGTQNESAGELGAQIAIKKSNGKGNFMVLSMPGQANLDARLFGYRKAFASHPEMKIVQVVDIHGQSSAAFDAASASLAKKGAERIDGYLCLEASSGKEVAQVMKNYKITDRIIVAFDTDQETLDAIRDGTIAATIAQKPATMTYVGTMMLDTLHHHPPGSFASDWKNDPYSPVPAAVDTGATLIDKSNLDDFIKARDAAASSK